MEESINIEYTLNNTIIAPNGISSVFSQTELISFKTIKQDLHEITFWGAKESSFDNKPLSEATKIAFDLGQAVYPLIFQRNKNSNELTNFKEVKERWNTYCEKACKEEKSDYVKDYIKSSSGAMKDRKIFVDAMMKGTFLQSILFRDDQETLNIPNSPNADAKLSWELKKSLSETTPQIWSLDAQPIGNMPYFVKGKGILEITMGGFEIPSKFHMELKVEMSNEGYYRKMVDINIIEE